MALIQVTFPFFMYIFLSAYLFLNIQNIGDSGEGSGGLGLLAASMAIGIFLFAIQVLKKKTMYIYKSFFFLMLFFAYILFRITMDIGELSEIKSFLFATTGGIILFYALGALTGITLEGVHRILFHSDQALKIFNFFFFISLLMMSFFLFDTLIEMSRGLRDDLFLIKDIKGAYQRPGSFLLINFILFSILYNYVVIINFQRKLFVSKLFLLITSVIYLIDCLGAMYLSQMFGSNNTFVSIGGLLFATFIFQILLISKKVKNFLSSSKVNVQNILLGVVGKKMILIILLAIALLVMVLLGNIYYFDIDLSKFRIFGFGNSDGNALSTRMHMLKNYPEQLNYAPLFGNIAVDRLTTGAGSYAHSFVASILSHLGFIGFFIFCTYLFLAIKEKLNSTTDNGYKKFVDNGMALYSLLIFLGIFLIASVGVFITWIPLWFLLGLVFVPIKFEKDQ